MAEEYDFKEMFSKDPATMQPEDYRAYNSLYLSKATNRPIEEVSANYDEVVDNFVGETGAGGENAFHKIKQAITPAAEFISDWGKNALDVVQGDFEPSYNGQFWHDLGQSIGTRGYAEEKARATKMTVADIIPSFYRGYTGLMEQGNVALGQEEEWNELTDASKKLPIIGTMIENISDFADTSGKLKKEAMDDLMTAASEEGGISGRVVAELGTTIEETGAFLLAMRAGGIKVGATPSQAANASIPKQILARLGQAGKLGAFKAVFSDAKSLEERAEIGGTTFLYMSTTAGSGLFKKRAHVFTADLLLNSGVTAPKVKKLWEREDLDDIDKIMESIKMVGADIVFSAMTKTMRTSSSSPRWKPLDEASRTLTEAYKTGEGIDDARSKYNEVQSWFKDPANMPKTGDVLNSVEGQGDKATKAGKGFVEADRATAEVENDIKNMRAELERDLSAEEKVAETDAKEAEPKVEAEVKPDVTEKKKAMLEVVDAVSELKTSEKVDEINRATQELADGKPPREVSSAVKKRVNAVTGAKKQPKIIKVNEYQMLKKQLRDYKKGAVAGKKLGALEQKDAQVQREQRIAEIKSVATEYAESKIRNKALLDSVKNSISKLTTSGQLDKLLPAIDDRVNEQMRLDNISAIKKEAKKIKGMKFSPALKKVADDLLDAVDIKSTSEKKLGSLKNTKEFFDANTDQDMPDYLASRMSMLEKTRLKDMTLDDLSDLKMGLQRVVSQQKLKEKLTKQGQDRAIEESANNLNSEVRDPDSPLSMTDKEGFLRPEYKGSPMSAVRRFDLNTDGLTFIADGGKEGVLHDTLVKAFWEGDDKRTGIERAASSYMEPFHDMIRGWDKADVPVMMGGTKIKISRGERIAIYLDSINPQNNSHVIKGGYVPRSNPNDNLRITNVEREAIIDKMTPEDFAVAQTIADGYQNILRPAINEASVKVNGHELAMIDNYHPMTSARTFMNLDADTISPNSLKAYSNYLLESSGHFKERTAGSKNPIVLQDAIKKYDGMVRLVSKYNGYAEPLRNAKALLNGKTTDGVPVRKIISSTSGTRYVDAFDSIIKHLEEGYSRPDNKVIAKLEGLSNKIVNNITRGFLGHNVKVATIQPISYVTAQNVIPIKHWSVGSVAVPASWKEMAENSSFMWDRGKGHMSIAFGESTKERSANRNMMMIREMDRQAVGSIWRACESWVKDDLGFVDYAEVAKRANDVTRRTQPTFDVIDRPVIARSNNPVFRAASMFSSVTTKNHALKVKNDVGYYNKVKEGTATQSDTKEWWRKTMINRVITPSLVALHGTIWATILSPLYGKKGDEEELSFAKKMANGFVDASLREMGIITGKIGSEIKFGISKFSDNVEGFGFSVPMLKQLDIASNSIIKTGKVMAEQEDLYMTEDIEERKKLQLSALADVGKSASILSGSGVHHYIEYFVALSGHKKKDEYEYKID